METFSHYGTTDRTAPSKGGANATIAVEAEQECSFCRLKRARCEPRREADGGPL
jgi:hypothetical protein